MKRIVIDNYIGVLGKHAALGVIKEGTSVAAAKKVRASCAKQADDFDAWARLIRANCIIPPDHPFRRALKSHAVPADDHLWTLGAIAFGTENPWIVIREIEWRKDEVYRPEEQEKAWLDRLAKDTVHTTP